MSLQKELQEPGSLLAGLSDDEHRRLPAWEPDRYGGAEGGSTPRPALADPSRLPLSSRLSGGFAPRHLPRGQRRKVLTWVQAAGIDIGRPALCRAYPVLSFPREIQLRPQPCLPAQPALRPHPHLGWGEALSAAQGPTMPQPREGELGAGAGAGALRGAAPGAVSLISLPGLDHRVRSRKYGIFSLPGCRGATQAPVPAAPGHGAGPGPAPHRRVHLLQGDGECWVPARGGPGEGRGGPKEGASALRPPPLHSPHPQVVLDCPADSCFEYIYQHEPYLRDPVAYPKVQVSGAEAGLEPPPRCRWGRGDPLRVVCPPSSRC